MNPTTITISGEGMDIIERLRAGMKSRGFIDLFGAKFAGVKLEAYPCDTRPHALLIAQQIAVVQPAPWSGDGLPPVGTECECQDNNLRWKRGVIVHAGTDRGLSVAVMQCADEILWGESGEFRPIKTPAQIAADEREAAIEAMIAACPYPGSISTAIDCAALYDYGLRFLDGDDK